jgi:hypothetical protein
MTGYEDPDHTEIFKKTVTYIPTDSIMQYLIADGSVNITVDWNPLVFAVFYQRKEIVEFLCNSPLVYLRSCLVNPF